LRVSITFSRDLREGEADALIKPESS
jgi:hypothetical protein